MAPSDPPQPPLGLPDEPEGISLLREALAGTGAVASGGGASARAGVPGAEEPTDDDVEALLDEVLRLSLAPSLLGGGTGPGEESIPSDPSAPLSPSAVALLADVGAALVGAQEAPHAPSRAVVAAATAAYDRWAAVGATTIAAGSRARAPVATEPTARATRPAPASARGWKPWAAAAGLLLALGAVFGLRGGEAEAGMRISALYRVDLSHGATSFEPARTVGIGEVLEAGPDALLAVGFAGSSKVVLGAGDAARVVRGPDGTGILALDRGTAFLTADGEPTRLSVGGHGILVVERGVARVETSAGPPEVAVAAGATARFVRSDGGDLDLAGPTRVRVERAGVAPLGPPERSLFRDLAFFGGAPRRTVAEPWIPARLWRIASGRAARLEGRLSWAPSTPVRLAWRPDPAVASARVLRLSLRGPAGLTVALEGFPGAEGSLPAEAGALEPGLPTIDIPLPEGWFATVGEGEMVIHVAPPPAPTGGGGAPPGAGEPPVGSTARARVRFDGVALAWEDDA